MKVVGKKLNQLFYQLWVRYNLVLKIVSNKIDEIVLDIWAFAFRCGNDVKPQLMKGRCLNRNTEPSSNALSHFFGRLLCERNQQDVLWRNTTFLAEVLYFSSYRKRLTAASTGQHQCTGFITKNNDPLLLVQAFPIYIG